MELRTPIRNRIAGPNIPTGERIASVVFGSVLAMAGARRRSLVGVALVALGGGLLLRGVSGRSGVYRMRAVRKGIEVRRSVTIQATPREVYDVVRDLRNLPRFMEHVRSVEVGSDGVARWLIEEGRLELEWRAEIVEDSPGRRLRWRSLPGGDLTNEGIFDLREAPGGRGTVVEVRLRYQPPGGLLVAGMLNSFLRAVPGIQLGAELARLRMLIETGELATGARNPAELAASVRVQQPGRQLRMAQETP